ncbi:hypothetical protein HS7_15500 [Sulfolobales archaeon HS-7]|nr:hypothetical protein HS7_15500 [Sulfolobales archaeon HS-7]
MEFPKFDCKITNAKEGYDSEIEMYLSTERILAGVLGLLSRRSPRYKDDYAKMVKFLDDIEDFLILGKELPDSTFLKEINQGDD